MAIIEFKNSYDLINYLCQDDVLGKLEVEYSQLRSTMLEPSFNFDYPALHQHLYGIFWDWPSFFGYNSRVFISFDNAEGYDVEAEDDMQWSDYDLSKDIYEYVQNEIFQKYGVESYLLISMEGTGFTLEEIDVEKLEIHKSEGEEDLIELDEGTRTTILNGILRILKETDTSILSVDKFTLQNADGYDEIYYCEEGSPDAFDYYELKDGESFILDTELLKTS